MNKKLLNLYIYIYRSVTQTDASKPSSTKRPRVKLTRAKLEKRAKLSRAKLASRRSGTRPARWRQTGTRQKGRAKVDWNRSVDYRYSAPSHNCAPRTPG